MKQVLALDAPVGQRTHNFVTGSVYITDVEQSFTVTATGKNYTVEAGTRLKIER